MQKKYYKVILYSYLFADIIGVVKINYFYNYPSIPQ